MNVRRGLVLFAAVVLCAEAVAGSAVYQWEDERGRVHFADAVPERFQRSARRIDVRSADIPAEQVRAAQAQADALRARAFGGGASAPLASGARRTAQPAVPAAAIGLAPKPDDCAAWQRAFVTSRDCYARHQTVRGGPRPGAVDACGPEIANPEPACGASPQLSSGPL